MSVEIAVVKDDVTAMAADVLLLKHAQGHYGADETVAMRLMRHGRYSDADLSPKEGQHAFLPAEGEIAAERVLFVGVPWLREFRYQEMRQFARRAIQVIAESKLPVHSIATTVHGPGYGLDFEEAFRWLVVGFQEGLTTHPIPSLERVVFVERNARRYGILQELAGASTLVVPAKSASPAALPPEPPRKKCAFVAMPFTAEYEDVYQFGIYDTVRKCGFVCEKVDETVFTGSIFEQIQVGIQKATFVVADLSLERPNVYLEVGYALGLKKEVILVAREGQHLHFDVSHRNCLFYRNIKDLAAKLEVRVRELFGKSGEA